MSKWLARHSGIAILFVTLCYRKWSFKFVLHPDEQQGSSGPSVHCIYRQQKILTFKKLTVMFYFTVNFVFMITH